MRSLNTFPIEIQRYLDGDILLHGISQANCDWTSKEFIFHLSHGYKSHRNQENDKVEEIRPFKENLQLLTTPRCLPVKRCLEALCCASTLHSFTKHIHLGEHECNIIKLFVKTEIFANRLKPEKNAQQMPSTACAMWWTRQRNKLLKSQSNIKYFNDHCRLYYEDEYIEQKEITHQDSYYGRQKEFWIF